MKKGSRTAGAVESFDNRIDPNTGKILLRAIFPNPQGRIVPGLFARIRAPTSGKYAAVELLNLAEAAGFDLLVACDPDMKFRHLELPCLEPVLR